MCGIVGIVELGTKPQDNILHKMTDQLKHRGPDYGNNVSFSSTDYWIGLGHRRLSVIDLSSQANQPMVFQNLSIVFNGEIYNYQSIRKDLESLGCEFKTHSDTEVLLQAFSIWGNAMVDRLKGMFAMAIFDRENHRLHLIRDRFGVKPLCYYQSNGIILFSSESKAFHEHPKFKKKISSTALAKYFQFGNVPAPDSIFENVTHLLPGTMVEINTRTLAINVSSYWNPSLAYQQPIVPHNFEEAKQETKRLLDVSVKLRLVSDVPLGLFLSGGYDSSTTAALLAPHAPNLKTFTVSVPDAGLNEGPKARQIANYLGTDHTEVECSLKESLEIIPKLPLIYDEPFADSSAIPTFLVSREAVKSVKVALSADGGDEFFAGYNRYMYAYRIPSVLKNMPPTIQRFVGNRLKNNKMFKGIRAQRIQKIGNWLMDASTENYMDAMTKLMSDKEVITYFNDPIHLKTLEIPKAISPLGQMLLMDTINYLPNDILHKVDRATMAVGLEGREPFLDFELMTFLAQLPDEFKCNRTESKILLKSLAHELIPKELLEGPKKGFAIPVFDWMKTHLRDQILEMLDPSFLINQDIFKVEKVTNEILRFLDGKEPNGLFTWYFFNFQLWYRQWMR